MIKLNLIQKIALKIKFFFYFFISRRKISYNNISFQILTGNWITKYRAETFTTKEPDTLEWIDDNLLDRDIFFDIGANIGLYSIYAALKKKNIRVFCFEPEYSNLNQLKKNILLNKLHNNITPFSIGVGNQKSLSFLHIQDFTDGAALHTVSKNILDETISGKKVLWKEGIACFSLDEICDSLKIVPNLIKIDIDGTEEDILNNAEKTFRNHNLRSILIEIEEINNFKKTENILLDFGFTMLSKYNNNQVWKRL